MVPSILLSTLPIPSLLLLVIITLYHSTPLLKLLPNLTPNLEKLSNIIPHPKRSKNLPREFFNLPPRPGSPSANSSHSVDYSVRGILGVRGCLILVLSVEALISLSCGWVFLNTIITPSSSSSTLAAGESGIDIANWGLIATSLVLLPSTIAWLSIFTILSKPPIINQKAKYSSISTAARVRGVFFKNGGITHSTLLPRILPISLLTSTLAIVLSAILPTSGSYVILGYTSLCLSIVAGGGVIGMWRVARNPREGLIRLRGESSLSMYEKNHLRALSPDTESTYRVSNEIVHLNEEDGIERMRDTSSWLSSPSRPPTPVSSFDYSSPHGTVSTNTTKDTFKTPKSKPSNSSFAASASFAVPPSTSAFTSTSTLITPDHHNNSNLSSAAEGVMNDKSWLSEPTNTPSSLSEWSFPDSPASPQPAITRKRSSSPLNLPLSPVDHARNPKSSRPGGDRSPVMPDNIVNSTPGPGSGSLIDASILGDYSPDPFHPLPRGFQSLTSFPVSPEHAQSRSSLLTRVTALQSGETLAMVPVERGSSTFTLQSYHSSAAHDSYKTPDAKVAKGKKVLSTAERRAPLPPPMPVDMPLPPTPTLARSSTLFEIQNKDSMELLMGNGDWVDVEREQETLQNWGRQGRGVGAVAVVACLVCYGFSLTLLLNTQTDMALVLYLTSLLLPSPFLALASWLLRYRPLPVVSAARSKKGSAKGASSTHLSLALKSESQLSLPSSTSPKLTPPAPKRASTMNLASPTLHKMIEPKPSLTTFLGSTRGQGRRHTVYGGLTFDDIQAEENMRKTLARRSGDVWISSGHAIEGGGLLSRATEMLKPVPAMRVLENTRPKRSNEGTLRRMRGGVVSMLAKRASGLFQQNTENDVELAMDQFEDADMSEGNSPSIYGDGSASPARSGIAISIIAPSPEKRVSQFARTASSYSSGQEGETDIGFDMSYATAEIGTARRGRMSNGPTFIFGKEKNPPVERAQTNGYDLDWMTAGVLPGLIPSIKIGNDVRVEPAPHSAPDGHTHHQEVDNDTPRRQRPLSDMPVSPEQGDETFATMPSFRDASFKQSTPHNSNNRKHGHTGSYSSSIDFTVASEYFTAETATSASRELRHRKQASLGLGNPDSIATEKTITHKPSFGLPKLQDHEGLEDEVRRSIDDLYAQTDAQEENEGIDLPPFPTAMALKHKPSLSRVSEMTEEPTLALSTSSSSLIQRGRSQNHDQDLDTLAMLSESALEEMHLAIALGSTTPASTKRAKSSTESTATGDLSVGCSILTNDEQLEEMERMMAMDTPTRTEFVISPPPPSDGRSSRASEIRSSSRASDRSVSSCDTSTTTYTSTTSSTPARSSIHYAHTTPAPPVPTLPFEYRQPAYPAAHPFPSMPPPPSGLTRQLSMPSLTMSMSMQAHPPIQSFLRNNRSTETLHSVSSGSTNPTPKIQIRHQQSKRELKLVQALEKRNSPIENGNSKATSKSAMGFTSSSNTDAGVKGKIKKSVVEKRGLRPLTLVTDNTSNVNVGRRSSQPLSGNTKKLTVLYDTEGEKDNGSKTSLTTATSKGMVMGKMSTGSGTGKENEKKGSKTSVGPAVVGVRGLRA
ncbi:uncharacterized protein I303_101578 [Kwoniella dejecticola CBS 10117]|uniref:Uncharacterized protein n=1 Tax=Kwoniella dejecticola CBS 10117 TaxID=1296121 RepID=A0A1A6ADD8_9TREE|nr:uncharacterized protein I303_02289 [Kwoniella dejecticola CBS 10117]OBR88070.1 hypothetical protein I303_02289 [Kwoniella dejecticola CBS 10117]